jgi:hypothetical protein
MAVKHIDYVTIVVLSLGWIQKEFLITHLLFLPQGISFNIVSGLVVSGGGYSSNKW